MSPPSPHTRTRLTPDERREQILAVAVDAFAASEYSAVNLDAVADAAGVTRGLLHHYFGSKRALYLEVVERSVRIPASTRLVPRDLTGPRDVVLAGCVSVWLDLISTVGGLWTGFSGAVGAGDTDVDEILTTARDDLVERMMDELPLSPPLDRAMLRGALRSYSAFARVAIDEWLARGSLDREQTHAMLTATLIALVDDVVPAMGAVHPSTAPRPADSPT